ncbi:unnamed protein product [Amoebophrya sp. A120]|nr:unnamed protein product [Amoebophrya sp. A120]|eukprot:GSA120T00022405001.1
MPPRVLDFAADVRKSTSSSGKKKRMTMYGSSATGPVVTLFCTQHGANSPFGAQALDPGLFGPNFRADAREGIVYVPPVVETKKDENPAGPHAAAAASTSTTKIAAHEEGGVDDQQQDNVLQEAEFAWTDKPAVEDSGPEGQSLEDGASSSSTLQELIGKDAELVRGAAAEGESPTASRTHPSSAQEAATGEIFAIAEDGLDKRDTVYEQEPGHDAAPPLVVGDDVGEDRILAPGSLLEQEEPAYWHNGREQVWEGKNCRYGDPEGDLWKWDKKQAVSKQLWCDPKKQEYVLFNMEKSGEYTAWEFTDRGWQMTRERFGSARDCLEDKLWDQDPKKPLSLDECHFSTGVPTWQPKPPEKKADDFWKAFHEAEKEEAERRDAEREAEAEKWRQQAKRAEALFAARAESERNGAAGPEKASSSDSSGGGAQPDLDKEARAKFWKEQDEKAKAFLATAKEDAEAAREKAEAAKKEAEEKKAKAKEAQRKRSAEEEKRRQKEQKEAEDRAWAEEQKREQERRDTEEAEQKAKAAAKKAEEAKEARRRSENQYHDFRQQQERQRDNKDPTQAWKNSPDAWKNPMNRLNNIPVMTDKHGKTHELRLPFKNEVADDLGRVPKEDQNDARKVLFALQKFVKVNPQVFRGPSPQRYDNLAKLELPDKSGEGAQVAKKSVLQFFYHPDSRSKLSQPAQVPIPEGQMDEWFKLIDYAFALLICLGVEVRACNAGGLTTFVLFL